MAGVGVKMHQEGFSGTLAQALAAGLTTNISWKVYAKSGYTAKTVTTSLVSQIAETALTWWLLAWAEMMHLL